MKIHVGFAVTAFTGLLLVVAQTAASAEAPASAPSASTAIEAALASPDRPQADLEQDATRKPREILGFLGVEPGMRVLDAMSAGGYYTELLARVVGVKGQVIAYNNPPYAKFAAKGIAERYAGDRLPNVRQVTAEVGDLELQPGSLDAVLFVMSYHDLYWKPADGSWAGTDPALLLAKLHAALKPGGVVVVQDHVANAGGDTAQLVDELHRIDPAIVKQDFARAGFEFDGESAVLAHPDDDHSKLVFEPGVRGKTDQFVFRFRKPRE